MKAGKLKTVDMDHVTTSSPAACPDLISELNKIVMMCDENCTTCQDYIVKLTNHIKTHHSGPSADQKQEQKETVPSTVIKTPKSRGNGLNPEFVLSEVTSVENFFVETPCPIAGIKCEPMDPDDLNSADDVFFDFTFDVDTDPDQEDVPEYYPVHTDENHNQIFDDFDKIVSDKCELIEHAENQSREKNSVQKIREPGEVHQDPDVRNEENQTLTQYRCDTCSECFGEKSLLIEHEKSHTDEKLKNGQCCNEKNIENNSNSHTGQKIYTCDQCQNTFRRADILIAHKRSHTGEKLPSVKHTHTRKIHKQRFTTKLKLSDRSLTRKYGVYTCGECRRRFDRKDSLKRHLLTHTGLRPYACKICGSTYTRLDSLVAHERKRKHKVTKCKSSLRKENIVKSLKSKVQGKAQTASDTLNECSVPKKGFVDEAKLVGPLSLHSVDEKHENEVCSICHKKFSSSNSLLRHMRSHTGEKPYKCDQCEKCYSRHDYLMRHKISHTGEKPYKCDQCNNCYSRRDNLVLHRRNHTGPKSN